MSAHPVLKVAYLVNQYPKVSHTFIRREIRALESQGIEITRIALRGWDGEIADPEDQQERVRTRYVLEGGALPLILATAARALAAPLKFAQALGLAIRMSRGSDRSLWVHLIYLAEASLVLGWLKKARVQHVHAHFGTNPAELACLVHALGGPRYSFTAHGPEEFDKPVALHLGEKIRRAAFVVGVSSFGSSQLRRWVEFRHWAKIRVVHCGLDEAFYRNAPACPPDGARLACVGRLSEQKGQLLLVQAAAELVARGRDFELVLAGDGELRGEIEAMAARHRLGRRIRITGWISSERVRSELLASRALVLPSFAEGLPVVIMEALALRRPVISTFVAGIPELVENGKSGWLVPAGDVGQLADAMDEALEAPTARLEAMGAHGFDRVVSRHSAQVEARKLATHFHDAISMT
jgi:colanic acid/amylovoran biosynthesis glycosyltransferase